MDKNAMMKKLTREAFEKGAFSGSWLYAENGEIVSKGAIGFCDPAGVIPVREDTLFDIGSVSKPMTATAIMLLVRDGLLTLDDAITDHFPEIPYTGVKIRHLLTHTSGLPDYIPYFMSLITEGGGIPDNSAVLPFLKDCGEPAHFAPGDGWEYCNTGYALLAMLTEKLSGMPFSEFLKKRVFEPSGMTNTLLIHRIKDGLTIENLALGQVFEDGEWKLAEQSRWKDVVAGMDGTDGAGYVKSSILDLYAWDRALRSCSLLTEEEQETMTEPVRLNNGEIGNGYGFGWGLMPDDDGNIVAFHTGYLPGYTALIKRWLDRDAVLITLCDRDHTDARAYNGFVTGLDAIISGEEPKPLIALEDIAISEPDRTNWESFCGRYEMNDEDLVIEEVMLKDGELFASVLDDLGGKEIVKLYPLGDNVFGRKAGMAKLTFREGVMMINDLPCKKL